MAKGPTYRVPFRRRGEGKTDYRRRLKLLFSRKPRVVVRKSNKHIRMQLVLFDQVGDKTFVSSTSSELKRFGYEGGTGNIPAAYLTGLLFGKKAKEAGFDVAILDTGLQTPNHCSKEYAALKGVVNSGMEIPHDPAVFPSDERVRGEHIANFKQDASIVDNFEAVKKGILAESGEDK
uniref:Large ribosomal subunit protein uL18 n=1 Tax=Candidatus Methanophaga sp. ANME-1 ERB7 TaxID=2759913 RepID=A0A7G9ZD84_9EURY|nr:50S ribosomal protein L18 [Methanosarcinales archaeon ANME-1 ERB7]